MEQPVAEEQSRTRGVMGRLVHTGLGSSSLVKIGTAVIHTHMSSTILLAEEAPRPAQGGLQIPDGLVVRSCTSHPGVLGSIPTREEPGKTGAPCVEVPGS